MPTLLLLILLFHVSRSVQSRPCIAVDSPSPVLVSLNNANASRILIVSLCPNASITSSTLPPRLAHSLSVQPVSSRPDGCQIVRAVLIFQAEIGPGQLVLTTPTCSTSIPLVVEGVIAYHLPSRDRATSPAAVPVSIPAPRGDSVRAFFAVKVVLPTGKTFRRRQAVGAVEVTLSPPVAPVTASLGVGDHSGNLQLVSTDDGSDIPRPQVEQTVTLRVIKSGTSAGFRIIHAPLVATVQAVRAPVRLSPTGGEKITLVVRRAAADERRLVLGDATVVETEYVRRGSKYLSSFIAPPLPWGRHKWRMELVTGSKITIAADVSGHVFVVDARPTLTALLPPVARPDTDGFVMLSGTFEDSVTILVDGEPPPARDVMYKASGEIIMHVPPVLSTFNGTVDIIVKSKSGKKSNALAFRFDPDAIYVNAVVMHASTDLSNGRFLISFLCNRSEPPLILARADSPQDVYEAPLFNFSVRTSASESTFTTVSSGQNGMVPIDPNLFGEGSDLEHDFVAVRIFVSQGDRSGETLVFISRQRRSDIIGVTVLPPFEAQHGTGHGGIAHAALEAHIVPLVQCRNATNFEAKTVWSINKTSVVTVDLNRTDTRQERNLPLGVGLGRTVIVPDHNSFSYFATVSLIDTLSGKTIAEGRSVKERSQRAISPSLRTFLNGGLRSITLPAGLQAYEIHGNVPDVDSSLSSEQVRFSWTCKSVSLGSPKCPEALFPVAVASTSNAVGFNVTTLNIQEGTAVEYSLTVRLGTRQMGNARLRLSVSIAESPIFPSSELSAGAALPQVLPDGSIQFPCYQHIILAILDPQMNHTYRFALFYDRNDTDIIETSADDILISHNGYWFPEERDGSLFGISSDRLEPGNYTLYGAREGKPERGRGASWEFRIERCPALVPYKLPFLSGEAGVTTFFAAAASVPPSRNQFFFVLKPQEEGDTSPSTNRPDSTNYLRGCTGSHICAFVIPAAGRYFVQIDMYDPSGTHRLSSETLESLITVRAPNTTESYSEPTDSGSVVSVAPVEAALLQQDEAAFLNSVLALSPVTPFEPYLLEDTIQGLQKIGSSPTLFPLRGSLIIAACAHLMLFDQVKDEFNINKIRHVVETTIAKSVSNDGPASALREPAALFYSVLVRKSFNLVQFLADGQGSTANRDIAETSRRSAASHIPLILASGRECGFLDRLVVNYPTRTRFNVSSGTPTVAKYDDYRIGINCFSGQVTRLLPEPATAERCSESEGHSFFSTPQVLVSVEQHDMKDESAPTEMLSGPTVQTRIMKLVHVNDSTVLKEDDESSSTCYKMRVSVYVPKDLAEDLVLSARGKMDISCQSDGLQVSSFDIQTKRNASVKSQEKDITIGSDGRVGTFLEASPPVWARLIVNGTQLRECIVMTQLEGSNNSTTSAVLFSILGAIALMLVTTAVVLACIKYRSRDKFSVPGSLAPWDSFDMSTSRTQSTPSLQYYNSGELDQATNEWEAEYRRLQQRFTDNDRREAGADGGDLAVVEGGRTSERVSGSALDEWEPASGSRVSSLLTATDSYTTSSGDLSAFGVGLSASRVRLHHGVNALPGFYVPDEFSSRRLHQRW